MHPKLDPEFALELLRPAEPTENKYDRGVLGLVTGSEAYPGAALLGVETAYELEIGMVGYLGPDNVTQLVLTKRPETVPGIEKAMALVLGSGISDLETGVQFENIRASQNRELPMVIDAGALQIVEFTELSAPAVLTPHSGEAEKLFKRFGYSRSSKEVVADPIDSAEELSRIVGQGVLLKGSYSVLAFPGEQTIKFGPSSSHLATAGTGDILAALIGTLLAKYVAKGFSITPKSFRDVSLFALTIHSEAAEIAASRGKFGASAICSAISEATGTI